MAKDLRWYWLTERRKFDDTPGHATLDLLRYDGARVESNAPEGYYLFSCDGTNPKGPVVERLRTYGVEPAWVKRTERDHANSLAWEFGHAHPVRAAVPA